MHVISFRRLREFSITHPDAETSLKSWYTTNKKSLWHNFAELKQTYESADLIGRYTVFNIGGNKYRLIARIVYRSQTVFIVAILTHEEYDLGKWKE